MSDTEPTRDELVSAYVDDELTDADRARVEADPDLLEQVQRFRAVARAVSAPVPPPPADHRQQAVAAALAASATAGNVRSLDVARARRRSPRVVAIASVAAVIAIVLLVVPIVLSTRNGTEVDLAGEDTAAVESTDLDVAADGGADEAFDAAASEALEAAPPAVEEAAPLEEEGAFEEEAPAEEEVAADAPAEEPDAEADLADDTGDGLLLEPVDLGEFTSLPELRGRILDQRLELTGPLQEAIECEDALLERFGSASTELQVVAVADGLEVISYVVVDGDGDTTLVVLDRSSCAVLTLQSL